MTYKLPELNYAYDALEPVIDKATMEIHHDRHHKTYVDNFNKVIAGSPVDGKCVKELLSDLDQVPEEIRTGVRNNGGGHLNHKLFWECMQPGGSKEPTGELASAIKEAFGSFDEFKAEFEAKGTGHFGSGWVWLVADKDGKLSVMSTANQDSPLTQGYSPLLGNDLWEHAYYLKHQNKRAAYLKDWWQVVNWDVVADRFANGLNCK